MRKLFFLLFLCCTAVGAMAQTYTSGLTSTGSGTSTDVRLGGANPLLVNTAIDLGSYTFGFKKLSADYFTILNNGNIGINNNSPAYRFDLLGTSRFIGQQIFQGTVASDSNALGSEMLSSANWTSTDWTGSYPSFSHNTGNLTALSNTLVAVSSTFYQVAYTVNPTHLGSFSITYGGVTISGITQAGFTGIRSTSTANLSITPTSDFDGSITISIRQINTVAATTIFASSDGVARLEIRTPTNGNNTFIGISTGRRNTTGTANTVLGYLAGQSNTTGSSNTFLGVWAGQATTSGTVNTFVGNQAGYNNVSGNNNTFFGNQAGYSSLTASDNTFVGKSTGFSTTTGVNNTFTGNYAGYYNLTGSWNTFSGYMAGIFNSSGINNSAFGYYAGYNNSTGGNNIFLGYSAGRFIADNTTNATILNNSLLIGPYTKPLADNQTNQIVIGYNSTGLGSNSTVLGNTSTTKTAVYGSLLIGTTADSASAILNINSTTRGALLPRMSSVQRTGIGSLAKGLLVFDNDSSSLFQWNGTVWQNLYKSNSGAGSWGAITGNLSSQADLQSALILKASVVSPGFTGIPTAPTASPANNSIQIATTAYVDAADITRKLNTDSTGISSGYTTLYQNTKNSKYADTLGNYAGATGGAASLRMNTYINTTTTLTDGVLAQYQPGWSNDVDLTDAGKAGANGSTSLTLVRYGSYLMAVERREGLPNKRDTLHLRFSGSIPPANTYRLSLNSDAGNFWKSGAKATLVDYYLGTSTDVSNALFSTTPLDYYFTTSSDPASYGLRFDILIDPGPPVLSTPYYTNNHLNLQSKILLNGIAGSAGQVLTAQGDALPPVWTTPSGSGSGWSPNGNAGTNTNANFLGTTDNVGVVFRTNNTNRMLIEGTGNVGIGTTQVSDTAYRLFVEKGIRTRKVKVDAITWADYVFDKEYNLPTLAEVDRFIQQNKHLPGVQSTTEVKKDGLDLAESQAILLKKVEELTLYLIELDKKVKQLSDENAALRKTVKETHE